MQAISGSDKGYQPFPVSSSVTDASYDQKELLAHVSATEMAEIRKHFDHPNQVHLTYDIKKGDWPKLIQEVDRTVLKAAYCQDRISGDELATAYIFSSDKRCTLVPFEDLMDHSNVQGRWDNLEAVPKNLRYFVMIRSKDLSDPEKILIEAFFTGRNSYGVAGGIKLNDAYALGSAALIRADKLAKGHPPLFIRGVSPRIHMYEHLMKNFSDFALLELDETDALLHGVPARGLFPYFHDAFHLVSRAQSGMLGKNELFELGVQLEKIIAALPGYTPNSIITDNTYNRLNKQHTDADAVRFALDEASGLIVDGELSSSYKHPPIELLNVAIKQKFRYLQNYHFMPEILKKIYPLLNEHTRKLGLEYFMGEYVVESRFLNK